MRYRIEYFPNLACVEIHLDKELTRSLIECWDSPDNHSTEPPELVRDLFTILGVSKVLFHRYSVSLQKGEVFTWDEIIFKAKGVILSHLDPMGELVELGSPILPKPPSERERREMEMEFGDGLL